MAGGTGARVVEDRDGFSLYDVALGLDVCCHNLDAWYRVQTAASHEDAAKIINDNLTEIISRWTGTVEQLDFITRYVQHFSTE
jgi:hypothetical protein